MKFSDLYHLSSGRIHYSGSIKLYNSLYLYSNITHRFVHTQDFNIHTYMYDVKQGVSSLEQLQLNKHV